MNDNIDFSTWLVSGHDWYKFYREKYLYIFLFTYSEVIFGVFDTNISRVKNLEALLSV